MNLRGLSILLLAFSVSLWSLGCGKPETGRRGGGSTTGVGTDVPTPDDDAENDAEDADDDTTEGENDAAPQPETDDTPLPPAGDENTDDAGDDATN